MRLGIIPFILLFAFLFSENLLAQSCGCASQDNCPVTVSSGTSTTVCYEVTDAFVNNLALPGQGVCGVNINFTNSNIGQQVITLCSPAGDCVALTGANVPCSIPTIFSNWDILFVPCDSVPHPDTLTNCNYPLVWDNCPDNCAWANAFYNGSYQPYGGCLEDFDFGLVNGQWCITMDNTNNSNGGQIVDFELTFCDESGFLCCDADAGSLGFIPDLIVCESDSNLILDIFPSYGATEPNPDQYGYFYLISQNNQIIAYENPLDFTGYDAGNYEVCGLSYLYMDSLSLPAPNSGLNSAVLNDNLEGTSPLFCGDVSNNCFDVTIAEPVPDQMISATICENECFIVGDSCFTESGNYTLTLTSLNACDTTVILDLTVLTTDTTNLMETICLGEQFSVGDSIYAETGIYETLVESSQMCDSLILLDLTVIEPLETTLMEMICEGEAFAVGDSLYSISGTYIDTIPSFAMCDSIVALELMVIFLTANIANSGEISCTNPTLVLNGNGSSEGIGIVYNWTTPNGQSTGATNEITTEINAGGTYILNVSQGNCIVSDTVEITIDTDLPIADAGLADTLNCAVSSVILDASNSTATAGNMLTYSWFSQDGCPILNPTMEMPIIECPDLFFVEITNNINGCKDTASVLIMEDILTPIAEAGQDTFLTCINSCIELNGGQSMPLVNLDFIWSTDNGNIKNGETTANPQVDLDGLYELIITNNQNFCMDTATVNVNFDLVLPAIEISVSDPNTLTCQDTIVTLNANIINNIPNANFQWNGDILNGQGTVAATIESAGEYVLIVTDTDNGCVDSTSVTIFENIAYPEVEAEGVQGTFLNCINDTLPLGGNNNPTGDNFAYLWTTNGGNFFPSDTIENPLTDAAGNYFLTITNLETGCATTDTVAIEINNEFPIADIINFNGELDCQNTSDTLIAENPPGFTPWLYTWTVNGEVVLNGVDSSTIIISSPDTIYLQVTNVDGSFCTAFDTAIVISTVTLPEINAGEDVFLDCENATVILNGSVTNPNLNLQWYAPEDTCILANPNALNPTVDCEGMYVLEATDNLTGCVATDTAFVFVNNSLCTPEVYAGADTLLNCYTNNFTTIAASGTMGLNYAYIWTDTMGNELNVMDVFNPEFGEGCYIFTIINTNFNISASDTVKIFSDTIPPIANVGPDLFLNCPQQGSCIPLDVSGTSVGDDYTYEWGTVNGTFCTDSLALNIEISGIGFYDLTVIDTTNGCDALDAMTVNAVGESPIANAGVTMQLECGIDTIILDGSGSFLPLDIEISWFSNTGTILNGNTTLMPTVEGSGISDTFFIALNNPENLCTDTAFVEILAAEGCFPTCGILPPLPLTCERDTVCIDTIGTSAGPDICYLWTPIGGTGGPIAGDDTQAIACVTAAGFYELAVTKKVNGAQFTTSCQVQVMEEINAPITDAGDIQFLTCADTCVTLDGTNSAINSTYLWTTLNGNIKSGETTLEPTVNQPGTYTLTVTSLVNSCTSMDNVLVDTDFTTPIIINIPEEVIGCSGQTVVNADATTSGVTYQWTTINGSIFTGENSLNPIVTQEGEYCLTVTDIGSDCSVTECTMVELDGNLPTADAGADVFSTCLDTSFTLQGMSTGQNILTTAWTGQCINGNANSPIIMVDCPGVYTYTVTDNNGCQGSDNVEVLQDNLPPTADAGLDQTLTCDTLMVQLDATNSMSNSVSPLAGNLSFLWSDTNSGVCADIDSATPTICAGGIYTITVTDDLTGCTATDEAEVFELISIPQINVSEDTTLTCDRDTVEISGIGSSTNAPFIHLWETTNGNIKTNPNDLEICVDADGMYMLTLQDTVSGCEISDTVFVVMDIQSPTAAIDTQEGLTITCGMPTVTINGSISTPTDSLTFYWETIDGSIISGIENPSINVDSAGTYLLEVTNIRNGCTDWTTYTVNEDFEQPTVDFVPPPILTCLETEVQLEVSPPDNQPIYAFMWNGPTGSIVDEDTATPTVNQAVNYTVTITNMINGCTNSGMVLVEQNLTAPIAEATTLGSLDCIETTAGISGDGSSTGDFTYSWTSNSGGNIQNSTDLNTETNAPGWYFIEVTNEENGCTATDSTEVIASAIPITGVLAEVDDPDCLGNLGFIRIDSVLGGANPYVYAIDGKDFAQFNQFSSLAPGSYLIEIEDANGCTFEMTFTINPPTEVEVTLGLDLEVNFGDTTQLEALINIAISELDTVIWTPLPNPDCPLCLIQGIKPLETTTYSIQVIDQDGCQDFDKVIVFVDERPHVFAPNIFSPNGDGENEFFYLQTDETILSIPSLMIFDRWDNMVFYGEDFLPNVPILGWNGTFLGKTMNPQVFVWKAEVEFADGRVEVIYGDFVLMR
ncbi:MAG: gliding motility-associated-like protein [Paraglaciecola sp.]|jgi:gliding motility-associated-like protein